MDERVPVAEGVALRVIVDGHGGAGASFVLVHGLASNARLWDGVRERLVADGHRVAAIDLRGHGLSDKPDDGYDIPTVAADVAAVVAWLGWDSPVVAGQSWGGNVVVELAAARSGSSVAGAIVLIDGGWIDLSHFESWASCAAAMAPPRLEGRARAEVEGWLRSVHPEWPESGIQGQLACFEVRGDETVAPWLSFDRHMAVLRGLWEHRPGTLYPAVSVPAVLVPCGGGGPGDDRKRRLVEAAEQGLPLSRTRWFDAHHDVHAERPGDVAALLVETASWVDSLRP